MTRFRRFDRSARRWVAILLLVAGWGIPLSLPHASDDDLLCAVAAGDGPLHTRLGEPSSQPPPDHCVICHATRTFRTSVTGDRPVIAGLLPGHVLVAPSNGFHDGSDVERLPARAPPHA